MGNWSELPKDLLTEIARRLEAASDRARFSGVCRNWLSLAISVINYLPSSPPWLMKTETIEFDHRQFVGAGGKHFVLELPNGRGSRCIGSNGCWVVMIDAVCDMYILNPFSRVKIDLPSMLSLDDFVGDHPVDEEENLEEGLLDLRNYSVDKVILSVSESQSPVEVDFTAVAIYTSHMKLAYTKKGANSWQTIDSIHNGFCDAIFYQDILYAVNGEGEILKFNILCSLEEEPAVSISYPLMDNLCHERHLVEFRGMLLQVLNLDDDDSRYSFIARGFLVFKMDFTSGGWVEVNDLGQHSIFLGYNSGVSLLATSNYTFKPNCIYFSTHEYVYVWINGRRRCIGDVGVFDLTESIIVPYDTGSSKRYSGFSFTRPVWIVPTSLSQEVASNATTILDG